MFWFVFLGVLFGPILIIGLVADVRKRRRKNNNPNQYKKSSTSDERSHYSMGENSNI